MQPLNKIDRKDYKIRARQLDFLVTKLRKSNWGNLLMACAFAYFYWGETPRSVLAIWLLFNMLITVLRTLIVYPRYRKSQINAKNVNAWLRWFAFTLTLTGAAWAAVLPFSFTPNDPFLLLVLMFTFFILMVSATITLASYMTGFIAFTTPLMISIFYLFINTGNKEHIELGIAFVIFSIFTAFFYRSTYKDITQLITLQIEKENFAYELEQKKAIAEKNRLLAEQSVAEKNRFLAAASHDLRQPLHATGLLLSMLDRYVIDKQGEILLNNIRVANKALSHSFNSLMDVSKLDAGIVEVNKKHVLIDKIIMPIVDEFIQQIESKKLKISLHLNDAIVYSDAQLLSRIIRNIVSNAVKYTEEGEITINAKLDKSKQVFSIVVSDTGIGIPDIEQDLIFSEYYQLDNPERDRDKGFGLGLAIVSRLCTILDVSYKLESKIGVGTNFRIDVPAGERSMIESDSVEKTLKQSLSNITILIIDDDKTILSSMTALLASWGCKTLGVANGDSALKVIYNKKIIPDLIIADYRLRNNENGVEVCYAIFEKLKQKTPVLIVTGDTSPKRLQDIKKSNFDVLHKPVSPGELRSFLNRLQPKLEPYEKD